MNNFTCTRFHTHVPAQASEAPVNIRIGVQDLVGNLICASACGITQQSVADSARAALEPRRRVKARVVTTTIMFLCLSARTQPPGARAWPAGPDGHRAAQFVHSWVIWSRASMVLLTGTLFLSVEHISLPQARAAQCGLSQHPDFELTPGRKFGDPCAPGDSAGGPRDVRCTPALAVR